MDQDLKQRYLLGEEMSGGWQLSLYLIEELKPVEDFVFVNSQTW